MPDAPATASSDSTSGTPAANIVDSVRVQRAIVALSQDVADDRKLEHQAVDSRSGTPSIACSSVKNAKIVPPTITNISHHQVTKKSEIAITISVGAGRSAPKLVNTSLNAGITKTMMTQTTTIATTITEIG